MVLAGNQSKRCSEEAASAGSLPSPPLTLRRDKGKERDAEGLPVTLLPYVSDIFRVEGFWFRVWDLGFHGNSSTRTSNSRRHSCLPGGTHFNLKHQTLTLKLPQTFMPPGGTVNPGDTVTIVIPSSSHPNASKSYQDATVVSFEPGFNGQVSPTFAEIDRLAREMGDGGGTRTCEMNLKMLQGGTLVLRKHSGGGLLTFVRKEIIADEVEGRPR